MKLHKWLGAMLIAAGLFSTSAAQAADAFRVAYAGSMGAVMDQFIGPAFAKANGVQYQGIGQGSYGLARQLEGKLLQADVFISITPGPIGLLGLPERSAFAAFAFHCAAGRDQSQQPGDGCKMV